MTIRILGLDIREDSVSAVLLRGNIRETWVDAHAHVAFSRPEDKEKCLISCLENVESQTDISDAVCIVSLPSHGLFYRNLTVPFHDPQKIDQILSYELEPCLPVSTDDLITDFIYAGEDTRKSRNPLLRLGSLFRFSSGTSRIPLIAIAAEKLQMSAHLSALQMAGLDPERMVPGGYALALCLIYQTDSPSNWLLVDVNQTYLSLFLVFSRNLNIVRVVPCPDSAGFSVETLYFVIQQMITGSAENRPLDKIYFSGKLPDSSAFCQKLSAMCHVAVHWVNLMADCNVNLKWSGPLPWKPETGDHALSLSLMWLNNISGFNLRKGIFAIASTWVAYKSRLLQAAAMTLLLILTAWGYIQVDIYLMEKKLSFLNHQASSMVSSVFPELKVIIDPVQQMRTHVKDLQEQIRNVPYGKNHVQLIGILNRISSSIPENIQIELTLMIYEGNEVQISGYTDTFNMVEAIKSCLEIQGKFAQVTIAAASLDRTGKRIQFHLNMIS